MIKSFLKFTIFIGISYGLYYWYSSPLVYVDPENGCNIVIEQSFTYKQREVKKAIEFIKSNSPEYYKKMCDYVKVVDNGALCPNSPIGRVFACVHSGWSVGFKPLADSSNEELASYLVHETCHYQEGRNRRDNPDPTYYLTENYENNSAKEQQRCFDEQNKFLEKVGSPLRYPYAKRNK
ncbi:MAG TPA: hypothetical protein DEA43_04630 [Candidatus Moranbacteria bacterium]|nr:hypothetical protein [Candidatus Moranbacteria bacterium]HBT46139.1 hypothetical protein [Candidatus Moranbacteria bacterium]